MKQHVPTILVTSLFMLVLLWAPVASACTMSIDPTPIVVGSDGTATVVAWIEWEHRKCVLEDDDVNIDGEGIEILSESGWIKESRGLFKNEIVLRLTASTGTIRIWRDCEKKGISEVIVQVKKG